MSTILVKQPRQFEAIAIAAIAIPVLLFVASSPSRADWVAFAPACFAALFVVARSWIEVVRGKRYVSIGLATGDVDLHTVSALFRSRTRSWPTSSFGSIISYVTPSRFPVNRLELVTHAGGQSLLLASFKPESSSGAEWFAPRDGESAAARSLRSSLAQQLGVQDAGFVGFRVTGAQL